MAMKVGAAIAQILKREGVEVLFDGLQIERLERLGVVECRVHRI